MKYCIWCGHGCMSKGEIIKECSEDAMLPILIMRTPDEVIVPLFNNPQIAKQFIKRNLPSDWQCGLVQITLSEAQLMDDKGWKAIVFTFPRKLKDVVEFNIEIFDCNVQFKKGIKYA